ncbi:hypothetical protein AB9N12_16000 [Bacteroides sp. AN502(2024)]|uniref:hypothetical protein n=1 Tax=Bacteroides sp. AN502(2024) TaxID=3160599 RepID=UPI0035124E83
MITIKNTELKSAIKLCTVLNVLTKDEIVVMDEYISPNLKKVETAVRAAGIILQDPMLVLEDLNKDELKLVKEFVNAGPDAYISRKMRKMPYKLQKYPRKMTHKEKCMAA